MAAGAQVLPLGTFVLLVGLSCIELDADDDEDGLVDKTGFLSLNCFECSEVSFLLRALLLSSSSTRFQMFERIIFFEL